MAVLKSPVVLLKSAVKPVAVLPCRWCCYRALANRWPCSFAGVLLKSAREPLAMLNLAVSFEGARSDQWPC